MVTTKLSGGVNRGLTVLAKRTKYGVSALTYANQTQAEKAVSKIKDTGVFGVVIGRRPYYVWLPASA